MDAKVVPYLYLILAATELVGEIPRFETDEDVVAFVRAQARLALHMVAGKPDRDAIARAKERLLVEPIIEEA